MSFAGRRVALHCTYVRQLARRVMADVEAELMRLHSFMSMSAMSGLSYTSPTKA